MKQVKVKVSRVAGMAVLLAVIIGLTPILSIVPLFGQGVMPAHAAEETKWVLQDKDTKAPVATFQKDVPQSDGGLVKYDVTTSGTTLYYRTQVIKAGKVTSDSTYTWTFGQPPRELTPGQTVELTIQGKVSGNVSAIGVPARYTYHADYVENFRDKSADEIANLRLNSTSRELSAVLRFTTPPIPPIGRGGQITLVAEVPTIQNVVGTPGQFVWIYRVPEETPPASPTEELSLKFYHPFEYFKAGTGATIAPAGDVVATSKSSKPLVVVFYVDPETPGPTELGKNLYEVLFSAPGLTPTGMRIKEQPLSRKYLGAEITDAKGEARVNLIRWISSTAFSEALLKQNFKDDQGKISGTVRAGVYNRETEVMETVASVSVEFNAIAKILRISGKGLSTEYKALYVKEKGGRPWGPGRVRVKRQTTFPHFDYEAVEEGFTLMPEDIVDIDADVEVEIAWVTGEKVIARIPRTKNIGDVEDGELNSHARMVLLSNRYQSGFKTGTERVLGLAIEKVKESVAGQVKDSSWEMLIETVPWVGGPKKLWDFGVVVWEFVSEALEDGDWSKMHEMQKIVIRSKVIIENTGNALRVYNIEGAPSIETRAGGEVTLDNGKMVTVSDDGKLGSPQTFNVKAVEGEFYNNSGISGSSSPAKSNSSALLYALGIAALFVVTLVVFGILRKRKNA